MQRLRPENSIVSACFRSATFCEKCDLRHLAAAYGCFSVVNWLLKEGCDVNPVDFFGRTPLEVTYDRAGHHYVRIQDAVRGGHKEIAELLMSKGARVADKDKNLVLLDDSHLSLSSRLLGEFLPEWEIDRADIVILDKIGEGEFGVVHKALWHGTYLAVKILKQSTDIALADFKTELSMLRQCHHPHTVRCILHGKDAVCSLGSVHRCSN